MRTLFALLLLIALMMAAGAASAHATYFTDDGKYRIIIGNLGEPVYTYQKTGLDLIIRTNATDPEEVPGVNGTLNATLIAPGGEELTMPLVTQHGAVGRYSFRDGYTLTQPGLYTLRLVGTIDGSPVNNTFPLKHEIKSQAEIMFPAKGLPTLEELDARVRTLENKGTASQNAITEKTVPGPGAAFGVLAIAGIAAALALRRRE